MRLAMLFVAIFSISLRRGLAHRANLVFEVLASVSGIAAELAALSIVFTQVDALAGWSPGEAVVLLGTYQVVSGIIGTFVEPNVGWFRDQVIDGKLDDILLKPVSSVFLASLGTCTPLALTQVATGAVVIIIGVREVGSTPAVSGILAWWMMLVAGVAVSWASRVLLATLAFWAPSFQPDVLYKALWQFGRYPVTIYRQPARFALTWVFPLALIATLPAQALTGGVSPQQLILGVAVGLAAILIAQTVWRAGLRRYTSATS